MNATDFNKKMFEEIEGGGAKGKKLLLHACCAPCSTACLERLEGLMDVTVLFYNPNIETEEYLKRKDELLRFISETGWAHFLDCDHQKEAWYAAVNGLEDEKEGGARCAKCFELRLSFTARTAAERGYDYCATTLTVSPLKNAQLINAIGQSAALRYGVKWLPSDFKKGNGYLRSCQLSKEHNLYRQNYCGCIYSKGT
ncbi:MAG TPA: epoxyqueuosine reductase QueH [Candidatus Coproplasma excrementipullorum]|nr:epoxyqueuosine reductase QueH [Candidatus Coproplasma excrementipullorum]